MRPLSAVAWVRICTRFEKEGRDREPASENMWDSNLQYRFYFRQNAGGCAVLGKKIRRVPAQDAAAWNRGHGATAHQLSGLAGAQANALAPPEIAGSSSRQDGTAERERESHL